MSSFWEKSSSCMAWLEKIPLVEWTLLGETIPMDAVISKMFND